MNITDITSRECKAFLSGGGDLAIVPVASPERLGPHMPLGARGMVAETMARLLAKKLGGMKLPLVPYASVCDTFAQRGSIDMDVGLMHRYLFDLCDELLANRFKRIIVLGFQKELFYLCHEYFQSRNVAIAWVSPDSYFEAPGTVASSLDRHGRELWRLVACLRLGGDEAMLGRVLERTKRFFETFEPAQNRARDILDALGDTGHRMQDGEWRFYPVNVGEGLDQASGGYREPSAERVEQAAREVDLWLDTLCEKLTDLSVYQQYLDTNPAQRAIW